MVTFDANGGDFAVANSTVTFNSVYGNGSVGELPTPIRIGYTFNGWYTALDGGEEVTDEMRVTITADQTLYAHWTIKTYDVDVYVNDYGTVSESVFKNVPYGSEIETSDNTLTINGVTVTATPTQVTGYSTTFSSWDNASGVITSARTITANFVRAESVYTISFEVNTSSIPITINLDKTAASVTYNSTKITSIATADNKYFEIEGWYLSSDCKVMVADKNGDLNANVSGYTNSYKQWIKTGDATVYAKWVKTMAEYTYVSQNAIAGNSIALADIPSETTAKYLLIQDIDLGGAEWTPIQSFNGLLDGDGHKVYNFNIWHTYEAGIFKYNYGIIQQLQVGEFEYETKIISDMWGCNNATGMITAFNRGRIWNCNVINCSIDIKVNGNSGNGNEFWANAGGICGVSDSSSEVKGCYVSSCSIIARSSVDFNSLRAMARSGGLIGYANTCTIEQCLVVNNYIFAYARAGGKQLNQAKSATVRSGGFAGYFGNASCSKCVAYNNNVSESWAEGKGANGAQGVFFGKTESTNPSDLIVFDLNDNLPCWYSGTNNSYGGCVWIKEEFNYSYLPDVFKYEGSRWISENDGSIVLKFI